jgi:hypothetical protein
VTHEELLHAINNAKSYAELEPLLDISIANAKQALEKFKKYLPEIPETPK